MAFTQKLPEWNATGVEPSETQKQTGFQPGVRPPAQWFNWHLNWTYLALKELQEKAAEKSYVDAELDTIQADIQQLQEDVQNADIPDASLTVKGKVQLTNAIDSTSEELAPTAKAVKTAYDRGSSGVNAAAVAQSKADSAYTEATAAKQLGNERKADVVAALVAVGVSASTSETWTQLINKMAGVIRATGNATVAQVLAGATFSNASGNGRTGTMPNRGAISQTITSQGGFVVVPEGYHTGSGTIAASFANLTSPNVKEGVNIGGVNGSAKVAEKTVIDVNVPSSSQVNIPLPWSANMVFYKPRDFTSPIALISAIPSLIPDWRVIAKGVDNSNVSVGFSGPNTYNTICWLSTSSATGVVWRITACREIY